MKEKIAVLGPKGTFSHQAAKEIYGKDSGLSQNDNNIIFYKTIHGVLDRKSVVQGKSVDLGGRRIIKKKKTKKHKKTKKKNKKNTTS